MTMSRQHQRVSTERGMSVAASIESRDSARAAGQDARAEAEFGDQRGQRLGPHISPTLLWPVNCASGPAAVRAGPTAAPGSRRRRAPAPVVAIRDVPENTRRGQRDEFALFPQDSVTTLPPLISMDFATLVSGICGGLLWSGSEPGRRCRRPGPSKCGCPFWLTAVVPVASSEPH